MRLAGYSYQQLDDCATRNGLESSAAVAFGRSCLTPTNRRYSLTAALARKRPAIAGSVVTQQLDTAASVTCLRGRTWCHGLENMFTEIP